VPYIKKNDRKKIDNAVEDLSKLLGNAGEFNYAFTSLIHHYLNGSGKMRYQYLNEMIGMLECCKLELYRKILVPYENEKIITNGDVEIIECLLQKKRDELFR